MFSLARPIEGRRNTLIPGFGQTVVMDTSQDPDVEALTDGLVSAPMLPPHLQRNHSTASRRTAASQALQVMAISVRVGLCQPAVGQQAPSVTRTLAACQH